MRFTTLTLPNNDSVTGCTSFRILGASRDSVLRAVITSDGPPAECSVVIFEHIEHVKQLAQLEGTILSSA